MSVILLVSFLVLLLTMPSCASINFWFTYFESLPLDIWNRYIFLWIEFVIIIKWLSLAFALGLLCLILYSYTSYPLFHAHIILLLSYCFHLFYNWIQNYRGCALHNFRGYLLHKILHDCPSSRNYAMHQFSLIKLN